MYHNSRYSFGVYFFAYPHTLTPLFVFILSESVCILVFSNSDAVKLRIWDGLPVFTSLSYNICLSTMSNALWKSMKSRKPRSRIYAGSLSFLWNKCCSLILWRMPVSSRWSLSLRWANLSQILNIAVILAIVLMPPTEGKGVFSFERHIKRAVARYWGICPPKNHEENILANF